LKRVLAALLIILSASVALSQAGVSGSEIFRRLSHVRVFAFGGVGYAGVTSEGEKDFRVIYSEPPANSLPDFERLYVQGTPEARSYALAAIRKLDPEHFRDLAQSLRSSQERVVTMKGCIMEDRTMAEVVKEIDSGGYDLWLKPPTQSK
jgi:hypothetical protein